MASDARLVALIPVKKMSRAIDFYTKKLDAKLLYRAEGEMKDFWADLKVGGVEVWFVAPEKQEKRRLAYHTFSVKNIKRFVAKLKKRGVKFSKAEPMNKKSRVEGPIVFEEFGASAFFKDTEGNLLMVWQNFPPM